MNLRHDLNYDISFAISGFIEYLYSEEDLKAFAEKMSQDSFESEFSEDEYLENEYIGSLRIKLLFDLLHEILDTSHLKSIRQDLYENRLRLLVNTQDRTCVKRNFLKWIAETQDELPA